MIPLLLAAFAGIATHIVDGDTLDIGRTRVRLAGVDAVERDGSCHGHACPALSYESARANLASLALGRRVTCEPVSTSYGRIVAWCRAGVVDLSCEQVANGSAVVWRRYWPAGRVCR